MAASINGSLTQSLAAFLQGLQAKTPNTGNAGADGSSVATAGTAATATSVAKAKDAKGQAAQNNGQLLDQVTLSAQAQQILANAQAPSNGPGSLATFLNTDNTVDGIPSDSLSAGFQGAIEQFRQWLAQPLGQPVPFPGDQSFANSDKSGSSSGSASTTDVKPVSSASA